MMKLNHFWFKEGRSFILWLLLISLYSMLHLAVIAPILFKFWIIPKISKRYNIVFEIKYPPTFPPSSKWGVPPIEISLYVVFKCISWEKLVSYGTPNYPIGVRSILQRINYDTKTVGLAEIILSFVTFFCMVCGLFAIIFMGFPLIIRKLLA